jgi:hypothetical protein
VRPVVLEKAVGQPQVFARTKVQKLTGCFGFGCPRFGGAARAQLPSRKIYDTYFFAGGHSRQQRTRAGHFYVVGMSPQG